MHVKHISDAEEEHTNVAHALVWPADGTAQTVGSAAYYCRVRMGVSERSWLTHARITHRSRHAEWNSLGLFLFKDKTMEISDAPMAVSVSKIRGKKCSSFRDTPEPPSQQL